MSPQPAATAPVLDPTTAAAYAASLGLVVRPDTARLLSGGVSSTVVALDGEPPVVLKQALARLRVATVWDADPSRSETEADALRLLHGITPDNVPALLASDPVAHVIALHRAPSDWQDWRTILLEQPTARDVDRGRLAGAVLGRWHAATWGSAAVRGSFDHADAFEELRLDPFHRELLRRGVVEPELLEPLIDELSTARQCLVHGDYSPKNLLVGGAGLWAIDAEVAHVGAAVFDLAFLVAHLALKAVHAPDHAELLSRVARAFVAGYEETNPGRVEESSVARHAAAIMLARVSGKSPAPYLDAAQGIRVSGLAVRVLGGSAHGLDALWENAGSNA